MASWSTSPRNKHLPLGHGRLVPEMIGMSLRRRAAKTLTITVAGSTWFENRKSRIEDRIGRFQAACRGATIRPGDSEYETARKIWNSSVEKYPGIIARCSGVADVVAAVNFGARK